MENSRDSTSQVAATLLLLSPLYNMYHFQEGCQAYFPIRDNTLGKSGARNAKMFMHKVLHIGGHTDPLAFQPATHLTQTQLSKYTTPPTSPSWQKIATIAEGRLFQSAKGHVTYSMPLRR